MQIIDISTLPDDINSLELKDCQIIGERTTPIHIKYLHMDKMYPIFFKADTIFASLTTLTSEILEHVSEMVIVKDILFTSNKFSNITDFQIQYLRHELVCLLPNLHALTIVNRMENYEDLISFPNLIDLDIPFDPKIPFDKLTNLTHLQLSSADSQSSNPSKYIVNLSNLTKLKHFLIEDEIREISEIIFPETEFEEIEIPNNIKINKVLTKSMRIFSSYPWYFSN